MKLMYTIHNYDVRLFTSLTNSALHAGLVAFCRRLSKTADGLLYVLLAALLLWQHGVSDPLLQVMVLGFLLERPLYFLLKNGFKRNRPQQALTGFRSVITPSDQFSFPSGHTSAAFMVATMVSYFFPALAPGLYAWALAIGFSRVVLGVHFPTDTLMGAVLGSFTAFISLNSIL